MPDDGNRYEAMEGDLYVTSRPGQLVHSGALCTDQEQGTSPRLRLDSCAR